jgi:hypothetical protein
MKSTFRRSEKGQIVFAILAKWLANRLTRSGMTLPQWAAKGYALSAIGINKRNAVAELKPLIPLAHDWYNAHGDSRANRHYGSWEQYWPVLYNRLFYFFRKHNEQGHGKLVPAIAEWPGEVSPDGLSLVPPPVPQGAAALRGSGCPDDDDGPPEPPGSGNPFEDDGPPPRPGTGYPEDDPGGHPGYPGESDDIGDTVSSGEVNRVC